MRVRFPVRRAGASPVPWPSPAGSIAHPPRMVDAGHAVSRYHLHVAETVDGSTRFQTQEADTELKASATGRMLAGRGFVVWLYRHEHDHSNGPDGGTYTEIGMFIEDRFMPTGPADPRGSNRHQLR